MESPDKLLEFVWLKAIWVLLLSLQLQRISVSIFYPAGSWKSFSFQDAIWEGISNIGIASDMWQKLMERENTRDVRSYWKTLYRIVFKLPDNNSLIKSPQTFH